MVAVGSTLYFQANDGTNGYELWKSDGTGLGTVMVKNINPGGGGDGPDQLIAVGSTIYFRADNGTNGWELWKSDGTEAGTVMVKEINTAGDSLVGDEFAAVGSTLYFGAYDNANDYELWKSDGTAAGTTMVENIDPAGSSFATFLKSHGDRLYFMAVIDEDEFAIYLSDGTEAGTMRIPGPSGNSYFGCDSCDTVLLSTSIGVFFTYFDLGVGQELGFIADRLPASNTAGSGLALALLALSGALAAGAVIARRAERRAN